MFVAIVTAPALARVLDDLALALVLLRVQDVVRDALALQELREVLGGLDGDRADEDGLARLVALDDVVEHGGELRLRRLEDEVVLVERGRSGSFVGISTTWRS